MCGDVSLRRNWEEFITRSELILMDSKESLGKAGTCPGLGAVRTQGQFGRSFYLDCQRIKIGQDLSLVKKL